MNKDIRLLVNTRLGRATRHEFHDRRPAQGRTVGDILMPGVAVVWRCLETGDLRRYGFEREGS